MVDAELSYGDVGYHALGNFGRVLVEWAIVLSQTGEWICVFYFINNYRTGGKKHNREFVLLNLNFKLCILNCEFVQYEFLLIFLTFSFRQLSFSSISNWFRVYKFDVAYFPYIWQIIVFCSISVLYNCQLHYMYVSVLFLMSSNVVAGFCCAYLLFISTNLSDYIPAVPK